MGKTRDLFKKIRDTKGTFHAKMDLIKDRNGLDLTEAEDIKKKWQEYPEELRGTAREGLSLGSCSALCRALGTSLSSLSRPPEEFTTLKAPGRLGLATFHRR